jgi:hypothetical protein
MSLLASSEYARQKTVKLATAEWFNNRLLANPNQFVFVTLTAKQCLLNVDGNVVPTTREDMDREVGKFLKRLDTAVYGNAVKRHGKRLRRIDASHGGADSYQRLHRHLIIELPDRFLGSTGLLEFQGLVQTTWARSPYAREIIEVLPVQNLGAAAHYLVKGGGADNLSLANIVL